MPPISYPFLGNLYIQKSRNLRGRTLYIGATHQENYVKMSVSAAASTAPNPPAARYPIH